MRLASLLSLLLLAPLAHHLAAQDDGKFLSQESLGTLKLEQTAQDVVAKLGQPAQKGKELEEAATGDWVQEWRYPKQGLTLTMAAPSQGGPQTLTRIEAAARCSLVTSRGILIGSSEAQVLQAYKDVQNKEESTAGERFVAGSVYGGTIFLFTRGKVRRILIGAFAE